MDKIFALGLSSRCSRSSEILELALPNYQFQDNGSGWYARCRRIESALWVIKPRKISDYAEFVERRQNLFKLVRSRSNYAWQFADGYPSVQAKLGELAELWAI